jgi:hypothetical protein
MSQSVIPPFGTRNGVSPNPDAGFIDGAVATTFAIMYNYYDPEVLTDNTMDLNTTSKAFCQLLPYSDPSNSDLGFENSNADPFANFSQASFMNLFYNTNAGYFNVNPANASNPAICLSSQTYASSNSTNVTSNRFSLYQYLLKAYCNLKGISPNSMSNRILMLLQKECFVYQSLANVKGTCISLTWDELISNLVMSGTMMPPGVEQQAALNLVANQASTAASDARLAKPIVDPSLVNSTNYLDGYAFSEEETKNFVQNFIDNYLSAKIPLNLIFKYHSFVLDFDLDIIFQYNVPIGNYVLPTIPAALSS